MKTKTKVLTTFLFTLRSPGILQFQTQSKDIGIGLTKKLLKQAELI